ncbi:MAG: ATP-binding protein [Akkermansiaceae bacterium]|jgi:predicted ATPase|nr:ATP-binding protein [Akkermansiaceae bacterium]
MKISFNQTHKSIKHLPPTELANFAVITGTNGCGKSHLLEAINSGSIRVEDLPRNEGEIRLFDWTTFTAKVTDSASPEQANKKREQAIAKVLEVQNAALNSLRSYFDKKKIHTTECLADPRWLANSSEEAIRNELMSCSINEQPIVESAAIKICEGFIVHRKVALQNFRTQIGNYRGFPNALASAVKDAGISELAASEEVVRANFPLTWNSTKALQVEFANWFSAWHAAHEYNEINRYYKIERGDPDRYFLEDSEFRRQYGDEPWDIANAVLRDAGFRHEFNRPDYKIGTLEQPFQLRLVDPEDGTKIKTDELSSGEKILLAVTLMLYQTTGSGNLVQLPRLLLLDEIDAPLHPSFTRSLIDILNERFVKEYGVAVILLTHSPSTVALTPDESVYELVRKPREIRKASISSAIQVLSAGFVSVAPGDIVVITESSADPEYYQPLYTSLSRRGLCGSGPSLTFIAASNKADDGNGGGCSQVKNWAPKLHDLGLDRFRGLIDKDGTNQPDAIISVLDRYSIENYLFDPLTLSAYLIHRAIHDPFGVSAGELMQIRDFIGAEPATVMPVIRSLCSWLASKTSKPEIASSSIVFCDYVGFDAIEIPEWWLNTRGHDIETTIRAPLNTLGNNTGRGALLKEGKRDELIRFQSTTYPELISKDFISIFVGLRTGPTPMP